MQPYIAAAIIELIRLAAKLLTQARRDTEWTPEQEQAIRAEWEAAFAAPHWQPRDRNTPRT